MVVVVVCEKWQALDALGMKLLQSMLQNVRTVVVKLCFVIAGTAVLRMKNEIAVMWDVVVDDVQGQVDGEHNLPVQQGRDPGMTSFCQCPHTHFQNEDLQYCFKKASGMDSLIILL